MSPTDLTLQGWEAWAFATLGTVVLLLPGVAAADRWLRRMPTRFVWAPVLSLTLLPLCAILLDYTGRVDVRRGETFLLAFALAVVLGWPRLRALVRQQGAARRGVLAWRPPPLRSWAAPAVGLAVVLPFLFVAHSLPHLDGEAPASPGRVPAAFTARAADALTGRDVPYPVHVDEHLHMARIAAVARTGEVEAPDPYTGKVESIEFFTVGGLRSERGWQVAMVQVHHLTGASLPTLAHFLPALWATYLGLTLWATLRPAPGALASAALTAILPTTLRFLGPGFLVPSAFALPWILAVLAVAHRGTGPGRLVALALLVTGGFFMHIVPGTLALLAGILAALLRPVPWRDRLGLVGALVLPLVWILPASLADVVAAVTALNLLPFEVLIFRSLGTWLLVAAVGGAAWAWYRPVQEVVPHRVLAALALGAIASITWSIQADHSNDATYGRLIPPLFLCLAALAGLGLGVVAGIVPGMLRRRRAAAPWTAAGQVVAAGVVLMLAGAVVAHPLQQRLHEPYYRVFDPESWQAVEAFQAAHPGAEAVFLSHPWRAPVHNAVTGARPWTYLLPGSPPILGEDYEAYMVLGGGNPQWLSERGITYVIGPVPPNAPHQVVGPGVYRLNATSGNQG